MIFRVIISIAAFILPIFLLTMGIYGSFIFTFSIPLIWQIGFLGKRIDSLGIKAVNISPSIITGIFSGMAIGFIGGTLLRLLGATGYLFKDSHNIGLTIGSLSVNFSLKGELGYNLLLDSNNFLGLTKYFLFSVFLIGFGEELFWRGFIQRKIAAYFPKTISIFCAAFLFALIHFYIFKILPFNLASCFLAMIFIAGLFWGYIFERFDNMWPSAISHGLAAFIVWKYYF